MSWLSQASLEKFVLLTLVLSRISGLTMTAPIFGTRDIPAMVRVLLSVALSLMLMPTQWHVSISYPGSLVLYLVLVGGELLIGLCLGLAIVTVLSGIQLAGEMIGHVSGLMLADLYDPGTDTTTPVFSRLMYVVAAAVFVCIGGHRMVMAGLLETFAAIPPGAATVPDGLSHAFVTLLTQSFALAIRTSVPVVAALLLATLVLGLIARTLPQLNVLMIGFGLNAMVALAALSVTIGAAAWAVQEQVQPALETVLEVFQVPLRWDALDW